MSVQELLEDFEYLETWEERFRYIVELGRELTPMDDADKIEEHRVLGCQSRVWITIERRGESAATLHFRGDSDAQIVKGLIAIVFDVYDGQPVDFVAGYDIHELFEQLELSRHLTPSRANGLASMVEFIRTTAAAYAVLGATK